MRKNLKFEEKYEILIKYYNQNGNINIKQKQIYENYPVGKWLANFREAYKNNKLPEDQVEKLNKLNMLWSDVKKVSSISLFNKKYEILKAYYEEYGNLNISTKQVYKSYPVGDYVKQFRDSYRKQGNYTFLSESQIKQLESIDMVWNPKQEKEIIKEEVPSYFIKKYKNKSLRQVIILYKYLNNFNQDISASCSVGFQQDGKGNYINKAKYENVTVVKNPYSNYGYADKAFANNNMTAEDLQRAMIGSITETVSNKKTHDIDENDRKTGKVYLDKIDITKDFKLEIAGGKTYTSYKDAENDKLVGFDGKKYFVDLTKLIGKTVTVNYRQK